MEKLTLYIESLVFASEQPLTIGDIRVTLREAFAATIPENQILESLSELMEKYKAPEFSMEVVSINEGYQFMSKGAYHHVIGTLLKQQSSKKLSRAAMETLSIIAYKQPVSKSDMEAIRGVNCDYTVQKLLEKELIEMVGRAEGPGRPLLYGTSDKFMNYFGLRSIKELPKLKELETVDEDSIIGSPPPIESYSTVINIEEEE